MKRLNYVLEVLIDLRHEVLFIDSLENFIVSEVGRFQFRDELPSLVCIISHMRKEIPHPFDHEIEAPTFHDLNVESIQVQMVSPSFGDFVSDFQLLSGSWVLVGILFEVDVGADDVSQIEGVNINSGCLSRGDSLEGVLVKGNSGGDVEVNELKSVFQNHEIRFDEGRELIYLGTSQILNQGEHPSSGECGVVDGNPEFLPALLAEELHCLDPCCNQLMQKHRA